jgi:hypothetical protein
MNVVYLSEHCLKVVIRIIKNQIYLENCFLLGFKKVFINENGRWLLILFPKVEDEKLIFATTKESSANNNANMFSQWLEGMREFHK